MLARLHLWLWTVHSFVRNQLLDCLLLSIESGMFGPANIEAVLHDAEHDELDELENCEQTSTQEESQNTTNVTWERSLLNYLSQIRTVKYVNFWLKDYLWEILTTSSKIMKILNRLLTEKISHVVVDNFPDFRCSHTGEEYLEYHHVLPVGLFRCLSDFPVGRQETIIIILIF